MPTPSKATPARLDAIVKCLRGGNYRKVAALKAGISERTLIAWLAAGRANLDAVEAGTEDLDDMGRFLLRVEKAEAAAEEWIVDKALKLAVDAGKPEVLLKFLERRYPDRWGRRQLEIVRAAADVAEEAAAREQALRDRIAKKREAVARGELH